MSESGRTIEDTPLPCETTIEVDPEGRPLVQQANEGVEGFVNRPLVRGAGSITVFFALLAAVREMCRRDHRRRHPAGTEVAI